MSFDAVLNMDKTQMAEQAAKKDGFIAALDQSGGSTPKALRLYGWRNRRRAHR